MHSRLGRGCWSTGRARLEEANLSPGRTRGSRRGDGAHSCPGSRTRDGAQQDTRRCAAGEEQVSQSRCPRQPTSLTDVGSHLNGFRTTESRVDGLWFACANTCTYVCLHAGECGVCVWWRCTFRQQNLCRSRMSRDGAPWMLPKTRPPGEATGTWECAGRNCRGTAQPQTRGERAGGGRTRKSRRSVLDTYVGGGPLGARAGAGHSGGTQRARPERNLGVVGRRPGPRPGTKWLQWRRRVTQPAPADPASARRPAKRGGGTCFLKGAPASRSIQATELTCTARHSLTP